MDSFNKVKTQTEAVLVACRLIPVDKMYLLAYANKKLFSVIQAIVKITQLQIGSRILSIWS